jgi:hypothetical protein
MDLYTHGFVYVYTIYPCLCGSVNERWAGRCLCRKRTYVGTCMCGRMHAFIRAFIYACMNVLYAECADACL